MRTEEEVMAMLAAHNRLADAYETQMREDTDLIDELAPLFNQNGQRLSVLLWILGHETLSAAG